MKKSNKKNQAAENAPDSGWDRPFRDLKIDFPEPPPAPPAPPKLEEKAKSSLSSEDQELLRVFSGGDLPELPDSESVARPVARGFKLHFTLQRKGKGGKTVTYAHGLKALSIAEQMEICSEVRSALGIGARFLEGLLELQGDQRERAKKWFTEKGFPCI